MISKKTRKNRQRGGMASEAQRLERMRKWYAEGMINLMERELEKNGATEESILDLIENFEYNLYDKVFKVPKSIIKDYIRRNAEKLKGINVSAVENARSRNSSRKKSNR
jgi:hypothetical protein